MTCEIKEAYCSEFLSYKPHGLVFTTRMLVLSCFLEVTLAQPNLHAHNVVGNK